ncbi:MAG: hypothetical protein ACLPJH_09565 [Myxococcaceae bacterium]
MSDAVDNGLPEGWEALCRADAEALAPPEGAKERVRMHLAETLGVAAGLGAAGAVATAVSAGGGAAPVPAESLLGALTKALLLKKAVVVAVVTATAVTGGGVAYVEVRTHQKAAAAKEALLHRPAVAPVVAPPVPAAPAAPVATALPAAVEAPPRELDALGEERALLDAARAAIAQGRLGQAQALLQQHAQQFPAGLLVEEREALTIRLLVRQGHRAEATRRAARFRKAHPHSIQQPNIDAALGR